MERGTREFIVRPVRLKRRRGQGGGLTVADVARHAGLSPMNVSRVVNGGSNVQADRRERVEQAISEHGYVPNAAARSLAGSGPMRLVLLYSNPSSDWLSEAQVGSLAGTAATRTQLIVEHWDGSETADSLAERLHRQRADADLLPAPLCDDHVMLAALRSAGLHFAQIGSGAPPEDSIAVAICDEEAAYAMTRHLIEQGHMRTGFVREAADQTASALRERGYVRALTEADIETSPDFIADGDFTYRCGLCAAEKLLDLPSPPTAIFASNDDMAAAAISVAHRRGIAVPEALSVCGFDDTAIARSVWPELATIRQPAAAMAQRAITRLVGQNTLSASVLDFELIVRASSGPAHV